MEQKSQVFCQSDVPSLVCDFGCQDSTNKLTYSKKRFSNNSLLPSQEKTVLHTDTQTIFLRLFNSVQMVQNKSSYRDFNLVPFHRHLLTGAVTVANRNK